MTKSTYTREEDGFRCDRCGYFYPLDRTNGTPPDQCENCLDGAESDVIPIDPFSPEDLIRVFGDQAYHKAEAMVVEALRAGDRESCRKLSTSARVLMGRGYHKFPKTEPAK